MGVGSAERQHAHVSAKLQQLRKLAQQQPRVDRQHAALQAAQHDGDIQRRLDALARFAFMNNTVLLSSFRISQHSPTFLKLLVIYISSSSCDQFLCTIFPFVPIREKDRLSAALNQAQASLGSPKAAELLEQIRSETLLCLGNLDQLKASLDHLEQTAPLHADAFESASSSSSSASMAASNQLLQSLATAATASSASASSSLFAGDSPGAVGHKRSKPHDFHE